MTKVAIVEDNPHDSARLAQLLQEAHIDIELVAATTNLAEAYAAIVARKPDLVFLDVDLGGGESGFDLLAKFERPEFSVIFFTQHDTRNNAIQAVNASAMYFLPKPVLKDELRLALDKYAREKEHAAYQMALLKENLVAEEGFKRIGISTTEGNIFVQIANIIYCRSANNATIFHLNEPVDRKVTLVSSRSIKEWEKTLTNSSIERVHKSYMVNHDSVVKIKNDGEAGIIMLKNGENIRLSESYKKAFWARHKSRRP